MFKDWKVVEYKPEGVGVYPDDEVFEKHGGTFIKICGSLPVSAKLDIAHVMANALNRADSMPMVDNALIEHGGDS